MLFSIEEMADSFAVLRYLRRSPNTPSTSANVIAWGEREELTSNYKIIGRFSIEKSPFLRGNSPSSLHFQ